LLIAKSFGFCKARRPVSGGRLFYFFFFDEGKTMKQLQRFFHLVMFSAMLTLFACGGGGGGGNDGSAGKNGGGAAAPKDYAVFTPREEIILARKTIDDQGGVIDISGTGTALDGASVSFPAGALPGATEVSVGYDTGELKPPEGFTFSGFGTLVLHAGDVRSFNQLVEITIPYTGEADDVPTPFYVDETGRLHAVLVKSVDTEKKTITFVTAHASGWLWELLVPTAYAPEYNTDTYFLPSTDGFQIENLGSLINREGECFGMSIFAQWYYDEKMESNGDFFPKYMNKVGTDANGQALTGQDVIATRAHSASNQSFNFFKYIRPEKDTTDQVRWNAIVAALRNTKRPVLLSLKQHSYDADSDSFGYGHAVLAYKVVETEMIGELFIYDPNKKGDNTRKIEYDTQNQRFRTYDNGHKFTWFVLNGTGTYDLREERENIFQDAEHGFTSDNQPHITITSHRNGETVSTRNIVLTGRIESSEVLITELDIFVGDTKFSTAVSESGDFSQNVNLNVGVNSFRFVTRGLAGDEDGDNGVLTEITPNNLDANPFSVTANVDSAVMLVTLTWDKNDTDVDLYVIDPAGDYSAYNHQNTADGGELDVDDTDGFGPEHWTLTASDVVRCGGKYRVRVHYFDDHGNGGTNFKVTLKLYEGTEQEHDYVILSGYLPASNRGNDDPLATGPDWSQNYYEIPIALDSPACRANS
jgi:hypothetical protein